MGLYTEKPWMLLFHRALHIGKPKALFCIRMNILLCSSSSWSSPCHYSLLLQIPKGIFSAKMSPTWINRCNVWEIAQPALPLTIQFQWFPPAPHTKDFLSCPPLSSTHYYYIQHLQVAKILAPSSLSPTDSFQKNPYIYSFIFPTIPAPSIQVYTIPLDFPQELFIPPCSYRREEVIH